MKIRKGKSCRYNHRCCQLGLPLLAKLVGARPSASLGLTLWWFLLSLLVFKRQGEQSHRCQLLECCLSQVTSNVAADYLQNKMEWCLGRLRAGWGEDLSTNHLETCAPAHLSHHPECCCTLVN